MSKHVILDFDTMGTDPSNCAIVDVSVMVFEWDRFETRPYTYKDINQAQKFKVSVTDQVKNYGMKVENDVIDFWNSQPPEVKKNVAPKKSDLTVKEFTEQFMDFLIPHGNIDRGWSRSNTFDPVILTRLFDTQGKKKHLEEYLKYYLVRDTRTWIDAKLNFPKKNGFVMKEWSEEFKAHDSAWDILADVLRLQFIHRVEFDLEEPQ